MQKIVTSSPTSPSSSTEDEPTRTSLENGDMKGVNASEDEHLEHSSQLRGRKCLSGNIPDYIFICQNWY